MNNGNELNEIKCRVQHAKRAFYLVLATSKVWIHRKTKFRVYKTIIRLVLCYATNVKYAQIQEDGTEKNN